MKDGAIKDASTIGYEHFTNEVVEKLDKCYYIKEMREDDPDYQEFVARFSAKSEEEISKENQAIAETIANSILLPEDKTKELEELPEIPEE